MFFGGDSANLIPKKGGHGTGSPGRWGRAVGCGCRVESTQHLVPITLAPVRKATGCHPLAFPPAPRRRGCETTISRGKPSRSAALSLLSSHVATISRGKPSKSAAHYPLMQQQSPNSQPTSYPNLVNNNSTSRFMRPPNDDIPIGTCVAFTINGFCKRMAYCPWKHQCWKCGAPHPGRQCTKK